MNEVDNLEIRSEEVQEILGTPPPWIVRYGTFLALSILCIFVWLSFFIRYPDTVRDQITISFTEPPRRLVAAKSGYIDKVLVNNNEEVEEGQTLMVFGSTANYNHVLHLQDLVNGLANEEDSTLLNFDPIQSLRLGELQEDFFSFLEKKSEYERRAEQYIDQVDTRKLENQKRTLLQRMQFYRNRKNSLESRLARKRVEQSRKEELVRENRIPYREVQKVIDQIESLESELRNVEELIADNRIEISIVNTQINRTQRGVSENRFSASDALKESFIQLRIRVNEWVRSHVIQAPIDGIVQITGENIGRQQFIIKEEEVMVVVPVKNRQLLGRMEIPFNGSGPVTEGQEVIVRLDAYPYKEYGAVIGKVAWKSKVPVKDEARIPVEVVFPNGLITTNGRDIDPSEELHGEGEIITNEKRFIDRIISWTQNIRL